MFDENKYYLVSTKYLYYILGSGSYSDKIDEILTNFIKSMHIYMEHCDYEFDYYILSGSNLNILVKYYDIDDLEIVNDKKKLIREVV